MAQINLTPVELHLAAALIQEKIEQLDLAERRLVRAQWNAENDSLRDAIDTGRLVRSVYVSMARRVAQALDVPFLSTDDARELAAVLGEVVVA